MDNQPQTNEVEAREKKPKRKQGRPRKIDVQKIREDMRNMVAELTTIYDQLDEFDDFDDPVMGGTDSLDLSFASHNLMGRIKMVHDRVNRIRLRVTTPKD